MSDAQNNEKSALVPRLRFPEFREAGEWTTFELGNLSQLVTERVGTSACIPYTITTGVGLVSQEEKLGRTIAGNSLKNYIVLKKNDFAYNKSATKAYPQGFIACYVGEERGAVPNSIFTCFRLDQDLASPAFVDKLFSINLHGKWLRKRIAVGARAHGSLQVNDDDLLAIPLPLPSGSRALVEQQKIADCLSSLDELITAETQKLDALKTHKKGLMQQLFPREGETVPRLRFPDFREAGEWEDRSLESVCNGIASGKDKNDPGGQYDLYGSTGIIGKTSTASYRGEFLLVARVGANAGLLTKSDGEFGATDNTLVVRLNDSVNLNFVFYCLGGLSLNKLVFGSGQPLITSGQLKALSLYFPSETEQQKIADCLSSLDDLIAVQSQKIDVLKTHKRGLMQQLFPVLNEVPA